MASNKPWDTGSSFPDQYGHGPDHDHEHGYGQSHGRISPEDGTAAGRNLAGRDQASASITSLADFDPFMMSMGVDISDVHDVNDIGDAASSHPPVSGSSTTTATTSPPPGLPVPEPLDPYWATRNHQPSSHSLRSMPSGISVLTPSERMTSYRDSQISIDTSDNLPYDSMVAPETPHSSGLLWNGPDLGSSSWDYQPVWDTPTRRGSIGEDSSNSIYTAPKPDYQPIYPPKLPPRRSQSKPWKVSRSFSLRPKNQTIPEEDDFGDMAPMLGRTPASGGVATDYEHSQHNLYNPYNTSTELRDLHNATDEPRQFTSVPIAAISTKLLHELQQQELNGMLTGGIGAGHEQPVTQLRSSDLGIYLQSPTRDSTTGNYETASSHYHEASHDSTHYSASGGLLRSLSQRIGRNGTVRNARMLSQEHTIWDFGQAEANRLGKPVEVLITEPFPSAKSPVTKVNVDISAITGPGSDTLDRSLMSQSTKRMTSSTLELLSTRSASTKIIYYPQPNWKPFTMGRKYISFLIVLTLGLTIGVEVTYKVNHGSDVARFTTPDKLPSGTYFVVKFLPIIVSVIYGVLWQLIDYDVKRLEPFHQLSLEGGALASRSLNIDYITDTNILMPIQAAKFGHYAVTFSSIAAMLSVSAVPTLAAASLYLYPSRAVRIKEPDATKSIRISPIYIHLLSATLLLCASCAVCLLIILNRRKSGLSTNPRGIAGIAAMAVVSHILMDFKNMDLASHADLHKRLKYQRYVLQNDALAPHPNNPPLGTGPAKKGSDSGAGKNNQEKEDDDSDYNAEADIETPDKHTTNAITENPHPLILRAAGCIPFIISILLFAGLIPGLLFSRMNVIMDQVPWLITLLAVIIKLGWNWLDKVVRLIEPYYILSKRRASPLTLTLDYTAMPFGYMPYRALRNGHWLVFMVGFGSVIVEMLTVLLTSLSHVEGQDLITGQRNSSSQASSQSNDTTQRLGLVLALVVRKVVKGSSGLRQDKDDDDDDVEEGSPFLQSLNSGQETRMSFFVSFGCALFILVYLATVATIVYARRRRPFMPRQPNTIASTLSYIHQSKMLYDFVGTAYMTTGEREKQLVNLKKTYGLGTFKGRDGQSHVGVDEEPLIANYKHGLSEVGQWNEPWNTMWDQY
ncbi:hypothetical protein HOO65_020728 [Ceratocystis lukuohia]|uniref:Uncharacterized protein n=1 Tax=Ceratocystis lukuohia TaxID=2019550 RepID=A0ABR4MPK9_9PEZI